MGYAYEGADASFELLARRLLGEVPRYFTRRQLPRHGREAPQRARQAGDGVGGDGEGVHRGDDEPLWSVAEGNGPVNALDQALRKDLGRYQSTSSDVELVDYKVRILTGGTEAVTRVLVESRDTRTGERWFTVGVSPNIVDASFEALIEFDHLQAAARRRRGGLTDPQAGQFRKTGPPSLRNGRQASRTRLSCPIVRQICPLMLSLSRIALKEYRMP